MSRPVITLIDQGKVKDERDDEGHQGQEAHEEAEAWGRPILVNEWNMRAENTNLLNKGKYLCTYLAYPY